MSLICTPNTGTVSTVSDPHEIGNVLGVDGVRIMLRNAEQVPLKLAFGVPSCVPATVFETAGAEITSKARVCIFVRVRMHYTHTYVTDPNLKLTHTCTHPISPHITHST